MKKSNSSDTTLSWYQKAAPYFLIVLLSIIPLLAFFHPGLPITHDGKDHVARIANFYQNLEEGTIVPRWAANLNWGYGHPILMFLYPFPSYFGSFFHLLGFSYVDSVKAVFMVSFIISGLTMYLWVSKQLNRYAGFIAAILYLFAPYRFVDLQVRGAYGEDVAFIFPPLVMYFLLRLSKKVDNISVVGGSIALAGLFLSHNAISIMFLPLFILYAGFLYLQTEKKKRFMVLTTSVFILGFALSAFFLLPALLEGKYTLRDIVTSSDYATRFVKFPDFIYGAWSFGGTDSLSKQVGILQWIFLLASIYSGAQWFKKKNNFGYITVGNIVIFILSLFIMTSSSKVIWDHISILRNFQFPWRFLTIIVFTTALSAGLVIYYWREKINLYVIIGLTIASVLVTSGYWGVNGYLYKPESFYSGIYEGTTDTGESAPIWSVRFMEKKPKAYAEIIDGSAKISSVSRTSTKHTYTIDAASKARIRENTLYFPGWKVFVDGAQVQPEFQDPKNRGLITYYVDKGSHTVQVMFTDTKIRQIANYISIFALVILFGFSIMNIRYIWKRFL